MTDDVLEISARPTFRSLSVTGEGRPTDGAIGIRGLRAHPDRTLSTLPGFCSTDLWRTVSDGISLGSSGAGLGVVGVLAARTHLRPCVVPSRRDWFRTHRVARRDLLVLSGNAWGCAVPAAPLVSDSAGEGPLGALIAVMDRR